MVSTFDSYLTRETLGMGEIRKESVIVAVFSVLSAFIGILTCFICKPCPLQVSWSTNTAQKLTCMTALKIITFSERISISFRMVECSVKMIIVYHFIVSYSI